MIVSWSFYLSLENQKTESRARPQKVMRSPASGWSSQRGKWRDCHSKTKRSQTCPTNETWARIELTELREELGRKSQGWRAQKETESGWMEQWRHHLSRRSEKAGHSDKQWNKSPEGASHRTHDRERPRCLAAWPPGNGSWPQRASPQKRAWEGMEERPYSIWCGPAFTASDETRTWRLRAGKQQQQDGRARIGWEEERRESGTRLEHNGRKREARRRTHLDEEHPKSCTIWRSETPMNPGRTRQFGIWVPAEGKSAPEERQETFCAEV